MTTPIPNPLPDTAAAATAVTSGGRVCIGAEQPGGMIGPYRLLEILGEGGFGTVWLAERREPFVQRVALKIIKAGMDTKAVIARFEQERQALAVMDHPSVAKVHDAGMTAMGRPYFVMEHVAGEPITDYCDKHRLTLRQRLELFIPVCEAVQHAHHKGIIHRDIKPSNILVSVRDDQPVPKVIDFGVAKAVSHTLTDRMSLLCNTRVRHEYPIKFATDREADRDSAFHMRANWPPLAADRTTTDPVGVAIFVGRRHWRVEERDRK